MHSVNFNLIVYFLKFPCPTNRVFLSSLFCFYYFFAHTTPAHRLTDRSLRLRMIFSLLIYFLCCLNFLLSRSDLTSLLCRNQLTSETSYILLCRITRSRLTRTRARSSFFSRSIFSLALLFGDDPSKLKLSIEL